CLVAVNARREMGADCRTKGVFEPASLLTMNEKLRCAARLHSKDMAVRKFFDHTNPDQKEPRERIAAQKFYGWSFLGENIAAGYKTVEEAMAAWMGSDGHCANVMNPGFSEVGIGFFNAVVAEIDSEHRYYWTQDFAKTD
ncbi:MAG: CAP domain-containing protein, partial [Pseudomonadota bacterium]